MEAYETEQLIKIETQRDAAMVEIWSRLDTQLKLVIDHSRVQWLANLRRLINQHRDLDAQAVALLQEHIDGSFDYRKLLHQTEDLIQGHLALINDLPALISPPESGQLWQQWETLYLEALEGSASRFTVRISKRSLEAHTADHRVQGLWKSLQRKRLWVWEQWVILRNRFRRFRHKKELTLPRFKRKVQFKALLDHQVLYPIEELLHVLWNDYQIELATVIKHLHEDAEHRLYDLLLLDKLPDVLEKKHLNQVISFLRELQTWSPRYSAIEARLNEFELKVTEQLSTRFDNSGKYLQAEWPFLGTSIHPNLIHHPPRVKALRSRLTKRSSSRNERWVKYLTGEQHEWLKDIELAILQCRLPGAMVDSLRTIQEQINKHILPAFAEPHRIISQARKRFALIENEAEADLRRDILSQNRLLLRDLRRDLLPNILEQLQQAKLHDRLLNLLSRSRHMIDQLPNSYTILQTQSVSRGRAVARFMDIDLKALVKAEAFPEYEKSLMAFCDVIRVRNDKLSRDITEIDQIIEFNLGAALELLSSEMGASDQQAAFKVVIEGS